MDTFPSIPAMAQGSARRWGDAPAVLDGDAQLSVGCRHTPAGAGPVAAACATVVGSLHRIS